MKIKSQEEIALAQEKANEMIRVMCDKIENLSEYTVPLYDVMEGYFFQDVDYLIASLLLLFLVLY